jgi:selenocysteine lyase/cysteine desulfurase
MSYPITPKHTPMHPALRGRLAQLSGRGRDAQGDRHFERDRFRPYCRARAASYAKDHRRSARDRPVTLYGDTEHIADKVGIVVFNIAGRPHGEVAKEIAKRCAIAVRQGAFCSRPYAWRLLRIHNDEILQLMRTPSPAPPGMVRVSFGIYNNDKEADALIETVRQIAG